MAEEMCDSCGKEYQSFTGLLKHRRKFHPETFSVECVSCNELFDTEQGMFTHHARSHGKSLRKYTFNCEYCREEKTIPQAWREKESRNEGKYCSRDCKRSAKREIRVCKNSQCSQEFEIASWKDNVFCSIDCVFGNREGVADRYYPTGKEHPHWTDGEQTYYGSSWKEVRKSILERDNYTCKRCSDDANIVHHIIPVRKFEEPEDAHYDDNLITVCRPCHPKVENSSEKIINK